MIDEFVQQLILNAPNLFIALWVIWRQDMRLDKMLENQSKLVDRLLAYVDVDKQRAEALRASSAVKDAAGARSVNP